MGTTFSIPVRLIREDSKDLLPAYQTEVASGMDLRADIEGQVRPRSGLAIRNGVTCLNSPGTIDSDFRGEISVILVNLGDEPFSVRRGDRIAQLVFSPVLRGAWREVDALDPTPRGEGGFGHTG